MTALILFGIAAAIAGLGYILGYTSGEGSAVRLEAEIEMNEGMIRAGVDAYRKYQIGDDPEPGEERELVKKIWLAMRKSKMREEVYRR